MNLEQNQHQPELFENVTSLEELVEEYNSLAQQAVVDHEVRATDVLTTHAANFDDESKSPGSRDIDLLTQWTQTELKGALKPTVKDVHGIVLSAARLIPSLLDDVSRHMLEDAKRLIASDGINASQLQDVLESAPYGVRPALKAALDATILSAISAEKRYSGASSAAVRQMVAKASSPQVRAAILASLDADVYVGVLLEEKDTGVAAASVGELLAGASTPAIRAAMQAGLDADVLADARSKAQEFGPYSGEVQTALSHASSETARAVMTRICIPNQNTNGQYSYQRTNPDGTITTVHNQIETLHS